LQTLNRLTYPERQVSKLSHKGREIGVNDALQSKFHEHLLSEVSAAISSVGFEVSTAVIMKNEVFLYVAPCAFIINRRFGAICRFHLQGSRNNARYVLDGS
jgi:hypothetical protein